MAAAVLMAVAIILSGSCAGILAVAVAMSVWLLTQSSKNRKLKIAIAVVLILLPVLYFFKRDSADGRLLIWRTTWNMVADNPIWGQGKGAFQAKYMLYQAEYINANPDNPYLIFCNHEQIFF